MSRHPWVASAVAFLVSAALLVLSGCTAARAPASESSPEATAVRTLQVDGIPREYRVHIPETLADEPSLVVVLHGGFGSALQAETAYGWDEIADREGVIVAYPQGDGAAWNAGGCCGAAARQGVDDVAFLSAAVAELQQEFGIRPMQTFATGMSNGALMTYRMACETNVFAAIAPVAGTIVTPCDAPAPASLLAIHGLSDDRVRFDGEPGSGATRVDGIPVQDAVALWRAADACPAPVSVSVPPVTTSRADCPGGRVVALITITDAGHGWPGAAPRAAQNADPPSLALDATEEIWTFFASL